MDSDLVQLNRIDWQLPGEEWRPIQVYNANELVLKPGYEISDFGRARSLDRDVERKNGVSDIIQRRKGKILGQVMSDGYYQVALGGTDPRRYKIHVLVCIAWIGPRPTPEHEVAHWDNNRTNNIPGNLRWATRLENIKDQLRHYGRHAKSGSADLYADDIREIRRLRANGVKGKDVATQFGISEGLISMIISGKRWGHIS